MKSLSNEGILLREYLSRYYANNRSINRVSRPKGGYCAYDPTIDIEKLEYYINLLRLHED